MVEISSYSSSIDELCSCSEELVSSAEIDQQAVIKESEELRVRYECLKAAINERLKIESAHKERIDEFYQMDKDFENWLGSIEVKIDDFEPILLDEGLLKQQILEAKVIRIIYY